MPRLVTSETLVLLVLPSLSRVPSRGEREEGWRQDAQRAKDNRKHIPGRHRVFDKSDVGRPTLLTVLRERILLHLSLRSCLGGVPWSTPLHAVFFLIAFRSHPLLLSLRCLDHPQLKKHG